MEWQRIAQGYPGRVLRDEGGGIAALVAISTIMLLASTGLGVDMGRGYVERLRLGRAVDAGSLAGARSLRLGRATAQSAGKARRIVTIIIQLDPAVSADPTKLDESKVPSFGRTRPGASFPDGLLSRHTMRLFGPHGAHVRPNSRSHQPLKA